MDDWLSAIKIEFEGAESARARGNEGQARVCARRAAGIAAREFFRRRGQIFRSPSAHELLIQLAGDYSLSPELRQSAAYLILRVNKEFKFPADVDLIAEAEKLCAGLLRENN